MKNEILRKIKYEKMKKAKLSNFVRIEREKIMSRRTSNANKDAVKQTTPSLGTSDYEDDSIQSSPRDKPSLTVPSPTDFRHSKPHKLSKEIGSFEEG